MLVVRKQWESEAVSVGLQKPRCVQFFHKFVHFLVKSDKYQVCL